MHEFAILGMSDTISEVNTQAFKEYRQRSNWDCGLFTVAYLEGIKRGDKAKIARLYDELHASKAEGTDILSIEDYFASRSQYEATANTDWTIEGIQAELNKGRQCVVAYQNWQKPKDVGKPDWGHYSVVFKIENGRVYLFDPGERKGWKVLTFEDFTKRWYELDYSRNDRSQKILWSRWAMSVNVKPSGV